MNKLKKYRNLLLALALTITSAHAETTGETATLSDPALEAVLQQGLESNEGVQLQSLMKADIDPNLPGEESVVVWTLLGPSYWSTHLTVLSKQNDQWVVSATTQLTTGKTHIVSVTSDGTIKMTAKVAGPNDPVCCPSQTQTLNYRYSANAKTKLQEAKP